MSAFLGIGPRVEPRGGALVLDRRLAAERCARLLAAIRRACAAEPPVEVVRARRGRNLHYEVLDGARVTRDLPEVQALYDDFLPVAAELSNVGLTALPDRLVAANVNIINGGGEYRWHYDRNAVTVLVYLTDVAGGELECYPGYRIFLRHRFPRVQRALDGVLACRVVRCLFGRLLVITPAAGRIVVMRGDHCLHSVRPLTGPGARVNLVFAYAEVGAPVPPKSALDSYLYSRQATSSDPNYARRA